MPELVIYWFNSNRKPLAKIPLPLQTTHPPPPKKKSWLRACVGYICWGCCAWHEVVGWAYGRTDRRQTTRHPSIPKSRGVKNIKYPLVTPKSHHNWYIHMYQGYSFLSLSVSVCLSLSPFLSLSPPFSLPFCLSPPSLSLSLLLYPSLPLPSLSLSLLYYFVM